MWCKYFYRYFSFSISSRLKPVTLLMSSILTFSFSIFFAISVLHLASPSAIPSSLPHLYPSSCAYSIEACSSLICHFTPIYSILLNCNKNRSSNFCIFRQTILIVIYSNYLIHFPLNYLSYLLFLPSLLILYLPKLLLQSFLL